MVSISVNWRIKPKVAGAKLTEYWDLHHGRNNEQWLVVSTIVEDTTYLHRGMLLMELERYEEAIPYFERVIEIKPEANEAHELLIGLYENLGRFERGIELTKQVLETHPVAQR